MASENEEEESRYQLEKVAGIKPSLHWINNFDAGQNLHHDPRQFADARLQQILNHDLRDVVREVNAQSSSRPSESLSASTSGMSTIDAAPQQWRRTVRIQQQQNVNLGGAQMKSTLPESFRLMTQLEEIVDVSRNAESRLSGNGAGNQQNRCLKLCLSDGYYDDGTVYPRENEASQYQTMIAMEVTPIPNLSINSKAGLKILLHGPIDIRWGVLMLHEGNSLVMGGNVKELAETQAKALEEAKKQAGVGVDPTIRALIWNPDTGEDQDNEDEGEQGSGDVIARPPLPMGAQAPTMPSFNPTILPHQPQRGNSSGIVQTGNGGQMQQYTENHRQTSISEPGHQIGPPQRFPARASAQSNDFIVNNGIANSNAAASNQSQGTRARNQQQVNPYARTASAPTVHGLHHRSSITPQSGSASIPPAQPSSLQNQAATPNNSANLTCEKGTHPTEQDVVMEDALVPASYISPASLPSVALVPSNSGAPPQPTANHTLLVSAQSPGSRTAQPISFAELRKLLLAICQDENLYRNEFGKSFAVSMKQSESHHYFNIEKVKKRDRKKDEEKKSGKKYEYTLHAKFGGISCNDGLISCAISGEILEPYFGYPAAELRQLSRVDREKSQVHVNEGGRRVKDAFFKLSLLEVTLLHSAEEFFRPTSAEPCPPPLVDGKCPILLIQRQNPMSD